MKKILVAVAMLITSTLAYADEPDYASFTFSRTGESAYEYTLHRSGEDITGNGSDANKAYADFFKKMDWKIDRMGDHVQIFDRLSDDGWEMVSMTMMGEDDFTYRRQWLFMRRID